MREPSMALPTHLHYDKHSQPTAQQQAITLFSIRASTENL